MAAVPGKPISGAASSHVYFARSDQAKGEFVRRQEKLQYDRPPRNRARPETSLSLTDTSVLAFGGAHSENAYRNALVAFLEQVKLGHIPRGTYGTGVKLEHA